MLGDLPPEMLAMIGGFLLVMALTTQQPLQEWLEKRAEEKRKREKARQMIDEAFKTFKHKKKDRDDE